MIVTEPAEIPETIPEVDPIVAIDVLLLVHVPPVDASDSVVILPTHTAIVPVIAAGNGLTVNANVVKQPAGNV